MITGLKADISGVSETVCTTCREKEEALPLLKVDEQQLFKWFLSTILRHFTGVKMENCNNSSIEERLFKKLTVICL